MIYFDNAATTFRKRNISSAEENPSSAEGNLSSTEGNPSSLHEIGVRAARIVRDGRHAVLGGLGVKDFRGCNLIFCGSGTEANNLALFGVAAAKNRVGRIIISDGEHACVEESARILESRGFDIVRIPTRLGVLDMKCLKDSLNDEKRVVLVSIMTVNNETGAVYDVASAFSEVKKTHKDAVTHTDAVQGFLKINTTPKKLYADLITVSAHKIHGPMGIGALFVDDSIIKAKKLVPLIYGGGQESGFRSGTENVPAIAAFGDAVKAGYLHMSENISKMNDVRNYLIRRLYELGAVRRNAQNLSDDPADLIMLNLPAGDNAAPHILNITLPNIKSEVMVHKLSADGIYVSSGSACSSNSNKVSRALTAFGLSRRSADCSIRISLSDTNTTHEADYFIDRMKYGIDTLVKMR